MTQEGTCRPLSTDFGTLHPSSLRHPQVFHGRRPRWQATSRHVSHLRAANVCELTRAPFAESWAACLATETIKAPSGGLSSLCRTPRGLSVRYPRAPRGRSMAYGMFGLYPNFATQIMAKWHVTYFLANQLTTTVVKIGT